MACYIQNKRVAQSTSLPKAKPERSEADRRMTAQTTKPPTKSVRKSRFKVDENKVKDLVINKGLSQDQAAKPTKQNKPKNKVTPAKSTAILAMKAAGMNTVEISKEIGLSQPTVWRHLSKITPENLEYQQLIANLPDQFAKLALDNANLSARLTKHLAKMSDEDLGSMNPVNIAAIKRTADVGLGITHDHYRLEAGLSTSNTASIRADIAAIKGLTRDASQQSAPSTQSK